MVFGILSRKYNMVSAEEALRRCGLTQSDEGRGKST